MLRMEAYAVRVAILVLCVGIMCETSTAQQAPAPLEPKPDPAPVPKPEPPAEKYVITASTIMRPGRDYHLSFHVTYVVGGPSQLSCDVSFTSTADKSVLVSASSGPNVGSQMTLAVPLTAKDYSYNLNVVCKFETGLVIIDETRSVRVEQKSMSILIQTDKAIYKPSQKVMFRVLAILPNLKPYIGKFDIDIFDPNGNKIVQLVDQINSQHGVVSGEMQLSDEPVLGDWKIKVEAAGHIEEKEFTVDEYVLPKFEVTIITPSFITTNMDSFDIAVESKYTYGENVKGTAVIVLSLILPEYQISRMETPLPELRITVSEFDGRYTRTITRSELISLVGELKLEHRYGRWDPVAQLSGKRVLVHAEITEGITGITFEEDVDFPVEQSKRKLVFLPSTPNNFKPGLPFIFFVQVTCADDSPPQACDGLIDEAGNRIELEILFRAYVLNNETNRYDEVRIERTVSMPDDGVVRVVFEVPDEMNRFDIVAAFQHDTVRKYGITEFKTFKPNGMRIGLQNIEDGGSLKAGDVANFVVTLTNPSVVKSLELQLISKGAVVTSRTLASNLAESNTISILMDSALAQELSPSGTVIVHSEAEGELIADSLKFSVDAAFANEVSVKIKPDKTEPGKKVQLTVRAHRNSYVGLLAVDMSVLLLKSGNDITRGQVLEELAEYDTAERPGGGWRCRWCWFPYFPGGKDTNDIFRKAGVLLMTNIKVYDEPPIYYAMEEDDIRAAPPQTANGAPPSDSAPSTRVRRNFPETWLWTDNANIGGNGKWSMKTTVPDTITSWVVTAFSVSHDVGLGIVPEATKLTVFKPFFISLTLPYSIIRGEEFLLQANIFNYLSTAQTVTVTLAQSDDFMVRLPNSVNTLIRKAVVVSLTVPAGDAKSAYFWIVPGELGNIKIMVTALASSVADALERTLLVEPEGTPEEYTRTVIFDIPQLVTAPITEAINILYPADVVDGSQHLIVTAVGAIMGASIQGLGGLLRMPYGCGEQNMVNFAPAIPILNYLVATDQLTDKLKAHAYNILNSGYTRELQFQHKDGSFSAFGDNDKVGSMWLTCFVMVSFTQANKYITIDPAIMEKAAQWIVNNQETDGSFPERGSVCHKAMQGGSSKGVALTAYALAALQRSADAFTGSNAASVNGAISKAKAHLVAELANLNAADNTYELAIVCYALTLVDPSSAVSCLADLDAVAIHDAGTTHWEKPGESTSPGGRIPYHIARSTDVELTAYMLLIYNLRERKLTGIAIMKWLAMQRNARGGFSSTQDTVLGIQAMAELASELSGGDTNMDITATSQGVDYDFDTITPANSLVMQSKEVLPATTDRVDLSATGKGLALVQVNVRYNVMSDEDRSGIDLTVTTEDKGSGKMTIKVDAKYTKEGPSGMTLIEFGLMTGTRADTSKLKALDIVKRVETKDKKVDIYLDQLTGEDLRLEVDTIQEIPVANARPALVKASLYYEPDINKKAHYGAPQQLSMCESCPHCCKPDGTGVVDGDDKCSPNPCKNRGKCEAAKNSRGYKCICKRGSGGRRCQKVFNYVCGNKKPCTIARVNAGWIKFKHAQRLKYVRCYANGSCAVKKCASGKKFVWHKEKCVKIKK